MIRSSEEVSDAHKRQEKENRLMSVAVARTKCPSACELPACGSLVLCRSLSPFMSNNMCKTYIKTECNNFIISATYIFLFIIQHKNLLKMCQ